MSIGNDDAGPSAITNTFTSNLSLQRYFYFLRSVISFYFTLDIPKIIFILYFIIIFIHTIIFPDDTLLTLPPSDVFLFIVSRPELCLSCKHVVSSLCHNYKTRYVYVEDLHLHLALLNLFIMQLMKRAFAIWKRSKC